MRPVDMKFRDDQRLRRNCVWTSTVTLLWGITIASTPLLAFAQDNVVATATLPRDLSSWKGWSRDVSEAIAAKVRDVADQEGRDLTAGTLAFIEVHIGRVVQPTLPLW
jgi:adenylate cyclase